MSRLFIPNTRNYLACWQLFRSTFACFHISLKLALSTSFAWKTVRITGFSYITKKWRGRLLHFFKSRSEPAARSSRKTLPRKKQLKLAKEEAMGKTSRIVVCGMASVGKTAILEQLIYGNVTPSTELYPTIEDIYVASVETERGTREKLRFYDTAGLPPPSATAPSVTTSMSPQQLARQMLGLTEGYVLVYDPARPETFDCLLTVKRDIDKNRDKKEVTIVILANRFLKTEVEANGNQTANLTVTSTINKANTWATRERIRHFEVVAMDRATLVAPFVYLASKLNPPPNKSTFPQLSIRKSITTKPDSAS